jgi:proteasome accessory factor C
VLPASDITERFNIPPESLEEHLQLLNLVNFGGGCYAVYTELQEGRVYVEKELFGDTFRSPPRLTPLEARAIRLALEFVGPMIAADAHTPLERVRRKLEETFGEFDLGQTAEPQGARAEEKLVGTLSEGVRRQRLVEIEYQKEGEETLSTRIVEPYVIERELPYWYVHTWDRTRDAQRSFRLDRMRSARIQRETFEPREGFRPDRLSSAAVAARIWYSKRIGRWKAEEGARPLSDGAALAEKAVGSEEWLVGEILGDRGEAVLLEPENLRKQVVRRAKALARELKVSRVAAKA